MGIWKKGHAGINVKRKTKLILYSLQLSLKFHPFWVTIQLHHSVCSRFLFIVLHILWSSRIFWIKWSLMFMNKKVKQFVYLLSDSSTKFKYSKVLMQGKLIAVAYALLTYWNQFSLSGICKQEWCIVFV